MLTGFLPISEAASIYSFKAAIRHRDNPEFIGSAYLQSMDCQREPQSKHPTGENPGIYTIGVPFLVLFKKNDRAPPHSTRIIYTGPYIPCTSRHKGDSRWFWWPGVGRLAQVADQPTRVAATEETEWTPHPTLPHAGCSNTHDGRARRRGDDRQPRCSS